MAYKGLHIQFLKITGILGLSFYCFSIQAQDIKIGIRIQKTQEMYWENGVSLQYSFPNFNPNQFVIGFDYVSSRFGTAYKSNAIKQDNYLLSGSWLFNKKKPYHVMARLNVGYFYSDLEEDFFKSIPHKAFLLSPEIGFQYTFKQLPLSIQIGSGYYIITKEDGYSPGTLQPLYYHLDLYYTLFKSKSYD